MYTQINTNRGPSTLPGYLPNRLAVTRDIDKSAGDPSRRWICKADFGTEEPFLPPGREMPWPEEGEKEIVPDPVFPEEEEYLPDEEEIVEKPKRTGDPYRRAPDEDFPEKDDPQFPGIGPAL